MGTVHKFFGTSRRRPLRTLDLNAYRVSGILPGEEMVLPLDYKRNDICNLHPERQIKSQLHQYASHSVVTKGSKQL